MHLRKEQMNIISRKNPGTKNNKWKYVIAKTYKEKRSFKQDTELYLNIKRTYNICRCKVDVICLVIVVPDCDVCLVGIWE